MNLHAEHCLSGFLCFVRQKSKKVRMLERERERKQEKIDSLL
jgi:hypothetical protein